MTAKELRIGNWVIDIFYDMPIKITKYFFSDGSINNIEPIELTEEILLKCGFEEYELNDDLGYALRKIVNGIFFKYDIEYGEVSIFINNEVVSFKYLHQLQNLYFSLTGEELEIKL